MAGNEIKIKVDVQNDIKNLRQSFEAINNDRGFRGTQGEEARNRIDNWFKVIEKLGGEAELTEDQFAELRKISGFIIADLEKFGARTSKISKELLALNEKLSKRTTELTNSRTNLNLKKEERSALKGKLNELQTSNGLSFWKANKKGEFTKTRLVDPEVISKNLQNGTLKIRNAAGEDVSTNAEYLKQIKEITTTYDILTNETQELEKHITSLTNIISGLEIKIQNQKTKDALTGNNSNVDHLSGVVETKASINKSFDKAAGSISEAKSTKLEGGTPDLKIEKNNSVLNKAFKQFTLYNVIINSLKSAIREAVSTVKELDKSLTEQAMVTGLTREQTYQLIGAYQDLAKQVGATTKEIAEVATEYMKQGKSIQESLTLTRAAVAAAKVARVSVGDSVNYLTTALNGFQLSAEEAMKVSDKFAAVAAASATDYDELAIALSKVAAQANLAGMSIDYTTALLTKGLETTREAPETMGTALKTIIARMRELADYGETLEGDTDINNVETQLSYIGIALRNEQGELRSTQDVLDELGRKWDTLNKNQQAAVAKALAGTRQQSRLLALMNDYERVIELQQISERSAGATSAQAATYLEGIEAAMNNIRVAWEKIITTLTDSEVIIGIFDILSNLLNGIGNLLSNDGVIVAGLITIGLLSLSTLNKQLLALEYSKQEARLQNDKIIAQKKLNIEKTNSLLETSRSNLENAKDLVTTQKKTLAEAETALIKAKQTEDSVKIAEAQADVVKAQKELNTAVLLEKEAKAQVAYYEGSIKADEMEITMLSAENTKNASGLLGTINSILPLMSIVIGIMQATLLLQNAINAAKEREGRINDKNNVKEKKGLVSKTAAMFSKVVSAFSEGGIPGVIAGIVVATALAAALGVTIAASLGAFNGKTESEKTAEEVNQLSNEIYKLTEKADALDNITSQFDKLDNKLIKTNADLKEMNSLLDQAADKLSDDVEDDEDIGYGKGVSEKEFYNSLQSDKAKREFLERTEENSRREANELRNEQISLIRSMNASERAKFFDENTTDASIIQAQDAIFAYNNNTLFEYIDLLKETSNITEENAAATEELTKALLEEMSVEEAWDYANDPEKVKRLTNAIKDLKIATEDGTVGATEVLTSDDYSLKEQVEAYDKLKVAVQGLGEEVQKAFSENYGQFEFFSRLKEEALDFIDVMGITTDEINNFYTAWQNLQKAGVDITQEQWEARFEQYVETIAALNGDIASATEMVFGNLLDLTEEEMNAFVTAYGNMVQVGITNMGQNMDKFKNTINDFYEKSLKWNEMSESDRTQFIADNSELFSGEQGDTLLKAFESGDYNSIELALANNDALKEQAEQRLREVQQELQIERARAKEERNEAYIAMLEEWEEYLTNTDTLYEASLETKLDQQNKQLEEYKSYLQEEQDALTESLEKRKEAYENYFDSLDQAEEDEDYEEQADLLISNLSKLGSSTNADAVNQSAELEKQLEDLEKERLDTLRERAQEAIIESMDTTLDEINEKFDKLLESNQALLAAMREELNNPLGFTTELIANKIESGATALEIQDYINSLQGTFGGVFGEDVSWDNISVREENNNLYLNVNGTDIILNKDDENSVYKAVMAALTQIGMR